MPNLLRLIYVSRATAPMELPALQDLLLQAQTRNAERGITGVLCTGRGYFFQALEGPEHDVIATYVKILKDPRHRESALLSIDLAAKRVFAEWAMAHVEGDTLGGEMHARLVDKVVLERDLSEPLKLLQETLRALRRAT